MKKVLFLLLAASVALASCKGDDEIEGPVDPENNPSKISVTAGNKDITETSAVLSGFANVKDLKKQYSYGIAISTDTLIDQKSGTLLYAKSLDELNRFYVTAESLLSGTHYYYRAFVYQEEAYVFAETKDFKTLPINANVATPAPQVIDEQSINMSGVLLLDSLTRDLDIEKGFLYTLTPDSTIVEDYNKVIADAFSADTFSYQLRNLPVHSTVTYLPYVTIADKTFYGNVASATTDSLYASVVLTVEEGTEEWFVNVTSEVSYTSNHTYNYSLDLYYLAEKEDLSSILKEGDVISLAETEGQYQTTLEELIPGTDYYFVTVATIAGIKYYSEVKHFKTKNSSKYATDGIIFKEVYFNGTKSYYFKDAFYELVNNSLETKYLDGIILSCIDRGYQTDKSDWALDDNGTIPTEFYPCYGYVMAFPGTGKDYPLNPGESIVLATQAMDHSSASRSMTEEDVESPSGDLSKADWELHIPTREDNYENPNVPSLEVIWYGVQSRVFMPAVMGQPLMLAKLPDDMTIEQFVNDPSNYKEKPTNGNSVLCMPAEYVIDAIDIQRSGEEKIVKAINPAQDAGYTMVQGPDDEGNYPAITTFDSWNFAIYTGRSLRRKCTYIDKNGRAFFKDTNNSLDDFIMGGQTAKPWRKFSSIDD